MVKKITNFLFKALVSLGFLAWIIFKVNWHEVFFLLKGVEVQYIVIYFIVLVTGIAISAYKWKILANFKGIELPLFDFFKLYLTGTFVNNFMPSFIGGDTYRAYQAGKRDGKYSQSASAVVMDRLTGLFGAMLLTMIFSLMNLRVVGEKHILSVLNIVVVGCVASVFLFFVSRHAAFWKKLTKHKTKVSEYVPDKILNFISELAHYQHETGVLLQAVGWSCLFGIVGLATTNYVLFLALGTKVNLIDYLSVIFLISFVSALPISINNIGVKEWAYVTFFGFFGVGSSIVITVAILSRFLQMLLSFFALPIYLKGRKYSI